MKELLMILMTSFSLLRTNLSKRYGDDLRDELFFAENKSSSRFLTACFIIGESHPRLRCYVLETAVQSQR